MPELIAVGPEPKQRWRRAIPSGEIIRLGRAPRNGWAVPWDRHISREHAELTLIKDDQLQVRRLDVARNYISYRGHAQSEFTLSVGEEFRIGLTSFLLADVDYEQKERAEPVEEQSFRHGELKRFAFHNADHRLEVLSQLPEIITTSGNDEELALGLVALLLEAIPHAGAAAVLRYPDSQNFDPARPIMLRWDSRDESRFAGSGDHGRFRPSRRLIKQALEQSQAKLHVWSDPEASNPAYTTSGKFDWAFCTPIKDESCRGWCLYVSGQFGFEVGSSSRVISEDDLRGDLRFTEMLSEFVGAIRRVRVLEKQQAGLNMFFSPAVVEMLGSADPNQVLAPRETEITSLFCDVRGFSRKAERHQNNLDDFLQKVSETLNVMTCGIMRYDGVIADFQGDSALGFWGWPTQSADGPLSACRAALDIHRQFTQAYQRERDPRAPFRVGIGIAHGRAIAGKIGSDEQAKIGVFGPVVNLGSRLEGMTKQLRVPILIDEVTAEAVREGMGPTEGRCRRLGLVRPYGLKNPLMVSELLPPEGTPGTISNRDIAAYEQAVDAVIDGRWLEALEMLDKLPATDRAKDFLIIFIAQNNYEPPDDWDGVITLTSK